MKKYTYLLILLGLVLSVSAAKRRSGSGTTLGWHDVDAIIERHIDSDVEGQEFYAAPRNAGGTIHADMRENNGALGRRVASRGGNSKIVVFYYQLNDISSDYNPIFGVAFSNDRFAEAQAYAEDKQAEYLREKSGDSDLIAEEEYFAAVDKLINELDELKVLILEMRYFEKRSFKEIASILNITESNAKVRTYRVLERLKKIMLKNIAPD